MVEWEEARVTDPSVRVRACGAGLALATVAPTTGQALATVAPTTGLALATVAPTTGQALATVAPTTGLALAAVGALAAGSLATVGPQLEAHWLAHQGAKALEEKRKIAFIFYSTSL